MHCARVGERPVFWPNPQATALLEPSSRGKSDPSDARSIAGAIRGQKRASEAAQASRPATRLVLGETIPHSRRIPKTPDEAMPGAVPQEPMDTSEAARWVVAPRTGTQRHDVLVWIAGQGAHGSTDEETRTALDLGYSSECARRDELHKGGWVEDSGLRRLTTKENEAAVWVVTEKGSDWLSGSSPVVTSGWRHFE